MTVPLALLLLALAADPRELLERVEAAYRNPGSYWFEVTETLAPSSRLPAQRRILLAGDRGGRFRFEYAGERSFVAVNDGRMIWVYGPSAYRQISGTVSRGNTDLLSDARSRLLGIWGVVTQWADSPRFVAWEELGGVRAARLELHCGGDVLEVWIDPRRAVVLRASGPGGSRITDYRAARLGDGLEPALFQFESVAQTFAPRALLSDPRP